MLKLFRVNSDPAFPKVVLEGITSFNCESLGENWKATDILLSMRDQQMPEFFSVSEGAFAANERACKELATLFDWGCERLPIKLNGEEVLKYFSPTMA